MDRMRKAHSAKHQPRPSLALASDDLGVLREGHETNEDVLRRQLLEKDRENDRLMTQIQVLQAQLAQRPPVEHLQALDKEYKNLDLLLQGTQRENERCMAELERAKQREKMLEQALAKVAGENWQSHLEIAPAAVPTRLGHTRGNSLTGSPLSITSPTVQIPTPVSAHPPRTNGKSEKEPPAPAVNTQETLAHIEQVRLLILGMEQRLQTREGKLTKTMERAEGEGRRLDQLRKDIHSGAVASP